MKKYDQDAFALMPVDRKEISDVLIVVGQIAIIKNYMDKVKLLLFVHKKRLTCSNQFSCQQTKVF